MTREQREKLATLAVTSRRNVLLAVGCALAGGCRNTATGEKKPAAARSAETIIQPPDWGVLSVVEAGTLPANEKGGTAVVLLHGYRANGDDLVGLARTLERPATRFIVPAALLAVPNGGRAWWELHGANAPTPALDENAPSGEPQAPLSAARAAVQHLLRTVKQRYQPQRLCVAGFSQGAMLALDVALQADPAVDRVAALSGLLLADSLRGVTQRREPRPAVFMSHGRDDHVLPFPAAERGKSLLEKLGFEVNFFAFDGGHTIPQHVVAALAEFLFA